MTNTYSYFCHHLHALTDDIVLLKLVPQSPSRIHYVAGQYVEALFDDKILPLSIANSPTNHGELEFHLRHNEAHRLAKEFLDWLPKNNHVILRGPLGSCTFSHAANRQKIIMLAGGTGFTPIKALLEEALHQGLERQLKLFWGIRRPQDAYKMDLLNQWKQQFSYFDFTLVLSEPQAFPDWEGATGLVHEYVGKCYPLFNEEIIFASGPYPMIKSAFALFSKQALKKEQFISDMNI